MGGSKPSSTARKERNARNWETAKERRRRRAAAQEAAHKRNLVLREATPWQLACGARRESHLKDKAAGIWQPAERNPAGFIRRTDGTRSWWEDPGKKDRKRYLETVVSSRA